MAGCKGQEIILVSRQNNSGTYAYFRKAVLGGKRDYKLGTHNMAQAWRAGEECIFMLLGEVIEHAPTGDMFVTPRERRTADYIESRYG